MACILLDCSFLLLISWRTFELFSVGAVTSKAMTITPISGCFMSFSHLNKCHQFHIALKLKIWGSPWFHLSQRISLVVLYVWDAFAPDHPQARSYYLGVSLNVTPQIQVSYYHHLIFFCDVYCLYPSAKLNKSSMRTELPLPYLLQYPCTFHSRYSKSINISYIQILLLALNLGFKKSAL